MKIKFTQQELNNKIYIKIWNTTNSIKSKINEQLNKIKSWKKYKIIKTIELKNWKTSSNIFLVVKNEKILDEYLEDIISELWKEIKKSDNKFSLALRRLKLEKNLEESFIILLAQNFYKFEEFKKDKSKYEVNILTNLKPEKLTKKIESIYFSRNLMNMPANILNPETYEEIIKKEFSKNKNIEIKIIKWKELEKIGANWIYSVGKWSKIEPRMVILKYTANKNNNNFIGLVWKWVTFDSWGYNLKPTWYMEDMNLDMWGSAVSLWIFKYLVETNYNKNLICAVWLVENLISDRSYTPTDIIKMYNWKYVRIQNTDAEWRLVLADTLSYVEDKYNLSEVFDFATLTGAAIVALWNEIIAIMWRNKKQIKQIQTLSWALKERTWELPLFEKYKKSLKTDFADLSNCSKWRSAWTITAWLFLSEFVKNKNWIHFDIAWADILENHPLYWNWWSWIWIHLITKYLEEK